MHRGYIKIWRKIEDSGWLKNHKLCTFWLWCMLKATHKEYDQIVGCQQIHLLPGQFIFGRKIAAFELDMSEQSIRTMLDYLRKSQNLTIKTTNKFSVISILNWDTYQQQDNEINQQINQPLTSNQPATNHKQEHKNIRIKEYTSDFLSFWDSYPNKKGKDAAWKAWKSRNGDMPKVDIILTAIETQKQSPAWLKDSGQFIPHPATWINAGRWMDEVKTEKKASW